MKYIVINIIIIIIIKNIITNINKNNLYIKLCLVYFIIDNKPQMRYLFTDKLKDFTEVSVPFKAPVYFGTS